MTFCLNYIGSMHTGYSGKSVWINAGWLEWQNMFVANSESAFSAVQVVLWSIIFKSSTESLCQWIDRLLKRWCDYWRNTIFEFVSVCLKTWLITDEKKKGNNRFSSRIVYEEFIASVWRLENYLKRRRRFLFSSLDISEHSPPFFLNYIFHTLIDMSARANTWKRWFYPVLFPLCYNFVWQEEEKQNQQSDLWKHRINWDNDWNQEEENRHGNECRYTHSENSLIKLVILIDC